MGLDMKTSICHYYLQGNDTKAVRKGRRRGSRGGQAPDEVVVRINASVII
ncbi:hypothetical protein SLEP1_g30772 [Rubroshorea leprosula]|uniref:Uncharacterized protein n=1 Tax=Rubroshorea leprosula TaxID=152421 RepID=A0AAV5KAD4_9ROSI|nr:hypothetical protein SLEP1_g30772 [Rubroshorea leprosula]